MTLLLISDVPTPSLERIHQLLKAYIYWETHTPNTAEECESARLAWHGLRAADWHIAEALKGGGV